MSRAMPLSSARPASALLARRADVLSPRMVRIVTELAGDWRRLDKRIETVTDEIEALAKSDDCCRRVITVPVIGPIISSAIVAAIGTGDASTSARFGNARDASRSGAEALAYCAANSLRKAAAHHETS